MSQQYDNNMRGVLFKNDKKEKDSHPDYKGNCEIEGTEYWMAAWIKDGKNGKFMSFSFESKEKGQDDKPAASKPATKPATKTSSDDFDDLPF